MNLQVIHANTSMLQFQELRGRNVELLIGRVRIAALEDDIALERLFDDSLVAVAGPESSWTNRRNINLPSSSMSLGFASLQQRTWPVHQRYFPGLMVLSLRSQASRRFRIS